MIYIMNSAVMPAGNYGVYIYRPASLETLRQILAGERGEWVSRIGYPQNVTLIREWTGITIPLSREATQFAPEGDAAFIMRLRSRVENPATKGAAVSSDPADWEFALVEFSAVDYGADPITTLIEGAA